MCRKKSERNFKPHKHPDNKGEHLTSNRKGGKNVTNNLFIVESGLSLSPSHSFSLFPGLDRAELPGPNSEYLSYYKELLFPFLLRIFLLLFGPTLLRLLDDTKPKVFGAL